MPDHMYSFCFPSSALPSEVRPSIHSNTNKFELDLMDETLNRGPLALLLQRQYEFPFGINIVQFANFIFFFHFLYGINKMHFEYQVSMPFDFNLQVVTVE